MLAYAPMLPHYTIMLKIMKHNLPRPNFEKNKTKTNILKEYNNWMCSYVCKCEQSSTSFTCSAKLVDLYT